MFKAGPGILLGLTLAVVGCSAPRQQAGRAQVSVAAASDLKFALDEVVGAFQQNHPDVDVRVVYGSSGNFYAQLRNNAPFDVYLSADVAYTRKLMQEGLALPNSEFIYGVGSIVVWTSDHSFVDIERLQMAALQHPAVRHIAIANPAHAPYGRAAEAAMRSLGVYDSVKHKLVFGENITQTLQFVESGSAEVGIVALSLALAPAVASKGRYWEIPLEAYPQLEQGGLITKWARDAEAAWTLRAFVLGPQSRRILRRFGFSIPGS